MPRCFSSHNVSLHICLFSLLISISLHLCLFFCSSLLLFFSRLSFSLLSSLLLIFSSLVFHLLLSFIFSLLSSLLFSLFRLVVSSSSVFFLCPSVSLHLCLRVLCCVLLRRVVWCCVCVVVCGAAWHAEKTSVCRFKTSPCVPAPRAYVLPHAGVVPVHTGTF